MRPSGPFRSPLALRSLRVSLLLALLAPAALARRVPAPAAPPVASHGGARAATRCDPLPGEAPERLPVLRSAVGLNYSNDMLHAPNDDSVGVCVLVDSTGTVREAGVSQPAAPFDDAALEAARWWVFEPARAHGHPIAARITVTVAAHVPRDADPIVPDVVALAGEAEARGDMRGALDAWSGALARVGAAPALQNEWAIRAQVVRLAALCPAPPEVPMQAESRARSAHNLMLRNIARADNADYASTLDGVLRQAPWYANAYRWRASARAASGQRDGAMRDVLCYRLAVRDSVNRALADRALAALARADTIAALTMLKN